MGVGVRVTTFLDPLWILLAPPPPRGKDNRVAASLAQGYGRARGRLGLDVCVGRRKASQGRERVRLGVGSCLGFRGRQYRPQGGGGTDDPATQGEVWQATSTTT